MLLLPNLLLPIELLLQALADQYFTSYCVTIISDTPLQIIPTFSYRYILLKNASLTDLLLNSSEAGCADYIVRLKQPSYFMTALDYVSHHGLIRHNDRKVIILPSPDIERDVLLDIFKMRESSFIVHLLLVVPFDVKNCEAYDLVTHKFVGPDNNDKPIFLDRWNSCSSFQYNANLFPHDISQLEGKKVTVACFTYTPYVLLDLDTEAVPGGRDGIEVRLMEEFCRWVNCTIQIIGDGGEEWGEVFENFTGLGVLGKVVEDRADFGIIFNMYLYKAALYSWYEEFQYMDFSGYGIRTAVTCIAPSPRLLASWTMPLLPFSLYMWIGLMFTFVYETFSLYIAQGFSMKKVFLTTFGIMITQSQSDRRFDSWRIRSVVGWMMLTGLVLDNAYGGGLASTFTVPRYELSVDTILDMVDRKVRWGATHDAWVFSLMASQDVMELEPKGSINIQLFEYQFEKFFSTPDAIRDKFDVSVCLSLPIIKQLVRQYHSYESEELKRLSFTRKLAYSIERLPAGYFAIGEYINDEAVRDFTILVEDFYYELCVVMMRKNSPYTLQMNKHIGRLHENGLMLAWERQIALNLLNYKVQIEVKLSRSKRDVETVKPITFRLLIGVYFLYGTGVVLSIIAFFGEIIWNRRK